jgi:hypothetical protein
MRQNNRYCTNELEFEIIVYFKNVNQNCASWTSQLHGGPASEHLMAQRKDEQELRKPNHRSAGPGRQSFEGRSWRPCAEPGECRARRRQPRRSRSCRSENIRLAVEKQEAAESTGWRPQCLGMIPRRPQTCDGRET